MFESPSMTSHCRNFSWDYILFITIPIEKKGKVGEVICLTSLATYGDYVLFDDNIEKVSHYYTENVMSDGLNLLFSADKIRYHVELRGYRLV